MLESGKKQPWYITRKDREPIFMAGITNFRPNIRQAVEVGFVIVTEDSGGGMVDIHDRGPIVLKPEDARSWMDLETPVEEAAHNYPKQVAAEGRIRMVAHEPGGQPR